MEYGPHGHKKVDLRVGWVSKGSGICLHAVETRWKYICKSIFECFPKDVEIYLHFVERNTFAKEVGRARAKNRKPSPTNWFFSPPTDDDRHGQCHHASKWTSNQMRKREKTLKFSIFFSKYVSINTELEMDFSGRLVLRSCLIGRRKIVWKPTRAGQVCLPRLLADSIFNIFQPHQIVFVWCSRWCSWWWWWWRWWRLWCRLKLLW